MVVVGSERMIEEFVLLSQRFIRLRPPFILPEQVSGFRERLESLRGGGAGALEDYTFLLRVFCILAAKETPPTMGELSTDLDVPLSSATRIVDWLVSAGLVVRVEDSHDRRVVRVRMTESGQQIYSLGISYHKERISHLLEGFTPEERAELLRLLTKLVDSLQAEM